MDYKCQCNTDIRESQRPGNLFSQVLYNGPENVSVNFVVLRLDGRIIFLDKESANIFSFCLFLCFIPFGHSLCAFQRNLFLTDFSDFRAVADKPGVPVRDPGRGFFCNKHVFFRQGLKVVYFYEGGHSSAALSSEGLGEINMKMGFQKGSVEGIGGGVSCDSSSFFENALQLQDKIKGPEFRTGVWGKGIEEYEVEEMVRKSLNGLSGISCS